MIVNEDDSSPTDHVARRTVREFLVKCLFVVGATGCYVISFFLLSAAIYWVLGDHIQFQDEDSFSYSGPGLILSNLCLLLVSLLSLLMVSLVFKKLRHLGKLEEQTWNVYHIASGLKMGFIMITIPFLVVLVFGLVSVVGIAFDFWALSYSFMVLLMAAAFEEILCRSFLLGLIRTFFGAWIGVVISALIFGVGHFANDNLSLVPIVELLLAGFVLGVFYVKYGLGAAIAFHFVWNFVQGPIYGFKISGTEGYHLLQLTFTNQNDIVSGIYFGLEGTIWAILVSVIYLVWVIYDDGKNLGADRSPVVA